MGLLDDAIRQHLELKRRHGADPGEVARDEHEALGPVRRETAAAEPIAPEGSGAASGDDDEPRADAGPVLFDDGAPVPPSRFDEAPAVEDRLEPEPAGKPDAGPEPAAPDPAYAASEPRAESAQETIAFSPADVHEAEHGTPPARREAPVADVSAPVKEPQRDADEGVDAQPGAEHAADDVEAEPGGAADADELDRVPDFLQETPEHDRLWFEQKPPKDFDF